MDIFGNIFYFVLVIGVLITIHELGHFLAARLTGMRAEVFCIGMGPRLLGWNRKTGFNFGKLNDDIDLGSNTDYRLAMFPIGGYVKISGMVDESMDTDFINAPPQPYEFRSKGSFAKILVMSAGAIMNFVLAAIIFSFIAFSEGRTELGVTTVGTVETSSIAEQIGFQNNDKIIKINNEKVRTWNEIIYGLTLKDFGDQLNVEVIRNNENVNLKYDGGKLVKLFAGKSPLGLNPGGIQVFVADVVKGRPAEKAGIISGDQIIAVNSIPINAQNKLQETLKKFKNQQVNVEWLRNNQLMSSSAQLNDDGLLGIQLRIAPLTKIDYSLIESIQFGASETVDKTVFIVSSIAQMFKGNVTFKESIAGPVMIFDMTSKQAKEGLASLLNFMALLSISLGFLNILPLPALDGGHIAMLIIEGIFRREIPTKAKLYIQQAGIILIIVLSIYVIINDVSRFL